jgi:lipopolysaccharide export LptBFGC system permease protein LptF
MSGANLFKYKNLEWYVKQRNKQRKIFHIKLTDFDIHSSRKRNRTISDLSVRGRKNNLECINIYITPDLPKVQTFDSHFLKCA